MYSTIFPTNTLDGQSDDDDIWCVPIDDSMHITCNSCESFLVPYSHSLEVFVYVNVLQYVLSMCLASVVHTATPTHEGRPSRHSSSWPLRHES